MNRWVPLRLDGSRWTFSPAELHLLDPLAVTPLVWRSNWPAHGAWSAMGLDGDHWVVRRHLPDIKAAARWALGIER